jgi:hypothetical protein
MLICNYSVACHWQAFGIIQSQTSILNFLVTRPWHFERWGGLMSVTRQWSILGIFSDSAVELSRSCHWQLSGIGKFVVDSDWNILSLGSGRWLNSRNVYNLHCCDWQWQIVNSCSVPSDLSTLVHMSKAFITGQLILVLTAKIKCETSCSLLILPYLWMCCLFESVKMRQISDS